MIATLLLSAAMVAQAKAPAPSPPAMLARPDFQSSLANPAIASTIRKKREAQAKKKAQRISRAIQERYAAEERALYLERMGPVMSRQLEANAQAYYQLQAGTAMQNIGIAARQDAETYRLRTIGEVGPGYLPALTVPRVVTPTEVINSQLHP